MAGLLVGMFLNLNFVAAGAVNPSIFYLISQAAVMLWIMQTRLPVDTAGSMLRWMPTASLVLLVVNLPFVSTLEPSAVIDDPAMILVFFGLLLAVSSRVASIRPAESQPDWSDHVGGGDDLGQHRDRRLIPTTRWCRPLETVGGTIASTAEAVREVLRVS